VRRSRGLQQERRQTLQHRGTARILARARDHVGEIDGQSSGRTGGVGSHLGVYLFQKSALEGCPLLAVYPGSACITRSQQSI
jgi:hypothetical protein